jgi:hypothetical protein
MVVVEADVVACVARAHNLPVGIYRQGRHAGPVALSAHPYSPRDQTLTKFAL